jgi:hypothetical protein
MNFAIFVGTGAGSLKHLAYNPVSKMMLHLMLELGMKVYLKEMRMIQTHIG